MKYVLPRTKALSRVMTPPAKVRGRLTFKAAPNASHRGPSSLLCSAAIDRRKQKNTAAANCEENLCSGTQRCDPVPGAAPDGIPFAPALPKSTQVRGCDSGLFHRWSGAGRSGALTRSLSVFASDIAVIVICQRMASVALDPTMAELSVSARVESAAVSALLARSVASRQLDEVLPMPGFQPATSRLGCTRTGCSSTPCS